MNERIKQLAEEAGIAIWGDAVYMYDPKDTLDSTVMAKFADVIVQEAIGVLQKRFMGDLTREDMEVRRCIDDVKKHFGVKQ